MKNLAAIILAVLLLPACSTMERWTNSSGSSSAGASNMSMSPAVGSYAANPSNLYFGD